MNIPITFKGASMRACVWQRSFFVTAILLCCFNLHVSATAWTTSAAGPVSNLSNWTDGTTSPTTFATPGDTWTIAHAMTISTATTWTLGTAAAAPVTLTLATGGAINITGSILTSNIKIYGNVVISGGTYSLGGSINTNNFNVYGTFTMSSGAFNVPGGSANMNLTVANTVTMNGGSISTTGGSVGITVVAHGLDVTAGTVSTGASAAFIINDTGSFTMSGGTFTNTGAGTTITINTHGNFSMTGGVINANSTGGGIYHNVYGNGSFSSTAAMTNTGTGPACEVHLKLPAASGTMLIDKGGIGLWSGTKIYIDAGCTAQLNGDFSTTNGTAAFGLFENGTLICPAAYVVNGSGLFTLSATGTLVVAHTTGINGAITTTGTKTFNAGAKYTYNGTAAQITGSYLPASLTAASVLTISNSAGVTLSQTTSTTGVLAFTAGILNTGAFTMTTPGAATAVTGAGASSYVNGTLIKTISGLSSVNYEVGDLNYAPMLLTFSAAGTGGSLGLKTTNGLHPSVATSGLLSTNMANHYWTITGYSSAGPVTVTPTATYNAVDILGGSNAAFVTQQYSGSAWLGAPLPTSNTAAPYTSTPAGIALASLAGDFIFGNNGCGTAPITGTPSVCVGSTTTLASTTTGGVWSSGATGIATVSSSGVVAGITAGTAIISYTASSCTVTMVVTVSTTPSAGTITGTAAVCVGATTSLSTSGTGGTWSSGSSGVATVSSSGVVTGVAAGTADISYTVTNSCGSATATVNVTVNDVPAVSIAGVTAACIGLTTTLTGSVSGGTWASGSTGIATVSSGGVVTGVASGSAIISYTVTNSCGSTTATVNVTISSTLIIAPITGTDSVCPGHIVTLTSATGGGAWSATNAKATVGAATGIVTGVTPGYDTVIYTVTNSCGTAKDSLRIKVRSVAACATFAAEARALENALSIFPNPNTGGFTFRLASDIDEEVNVVVVNIAGEKIRAFTAQTNKPLDMTIAHVPGMYLLFAQGSSGKYVAKFVIE